MFTGFESSNRYLMVSASNGEPYFYANEESGCCQRQCCSNQRYGAADIFVLFCLFVCFFASDRWVFVVVVGCWLLVVERECVCVFVGAWESRGVGGG